VIIGKLIPAGTGMDRFNTAEYEEIDSFYQTINISSEMR